MRVRQIMTAPVITTSLPGNRSLVLKLMIENHVSGVPVVNSDGLLVGIVTRNNIFNNTREEQVSMLMTRDPVRVTPSTTIESAARTFIEHRFNHLPVVEKEVIVGILTPTDLLPLVVERCDDLPVEELDTQRCTPLYRLTPLGVALRIMRLSGARAMPVLDDRGLLAGIVSDRDLFDVTDITESIAVSEMGLGEDEDPWTWEGLRDMMRLYHTERRLHLPSVAVEQVMVRKVVTTFYKSSVADAARVMHKRNLGQLPLVDSRNQLMGMIYSHDLMRGLLPAQ